MTTRREFLKRVAMGTTGAALIPAITVCSKQASSKKVNVLFIAVDDLRPQLGCYGKKQIISPNIDRLAQHGLLFENAYCQEPICMASRASLLSGYRPDYAHIYNCDSLKKLVPDALTLNKHFKQNGYQTWATGKIYHHREDHLQQFGDNWVEPEGAWQDRGYVSKEAIDKVNEYAKVYKKIRGGDSNGRGPAYEMADVADNEYSDGASTDLALKKLQQFKASDKPFFMAVGFHKPHLPFNAPKKYWDMYSENDINLADNPFLPEGATQFTKYTFGELRNYYGIPKDDNVLPDDLSRKLIHGYYACVTYVDAQIGRLLGELDKLKLTENTVIVLWGDHGWKLGEHGMWCKHTPFELDCHVPMIFCAPGMKHAGKRTTALSEFVDIYPTLCDLCGLDIPDHLQGDSLVPVLEEPTRPWQQAAFTQWPKQNRRDPDKVVTGYSIKTKQYRYTEWTRNKTGEILARELYDHQTDPNENKNIAESHTNQNLVTQLSDLLDGGRGWEKMRFRNQKE